MTLHSFSSETPLKNDKKTNAQTQKDKKRERGRERDHNNNGLEPKKTGGCSVTISGNRRKLKLVVRKAKKEPVKPQELWKVPELITKLG